jgi:hypothetical protein
LNHALSPPPRGDAGGTPMTDMGSATAPATTAAKRLVVVHGPALPPDHMAWIAERAELGLLVPVEAGGFLTWNEWTVKDSTETLVRLVGTKEELALLSAEDVNGLVVRLLREQTVESLGPEAYDIDHVLAAASVDAAKALPPEILSALNAPRVWCTGWTGTPWSGPRVDVENTAMPMTRAVPIVGAYADALPQAVSIRRRDARTIALSPYARSTSMDDDVAIKDPVGTMRALRRCRTHGA